MTDIEAKILAGLDESQREAVTTIDRPLMVVAGPGTGKTLTIVRRIAYLVHQGVEPGHILAVTFTNRAALEMRNRTGAFLGKSAHSVFIGTFHMLGLTIIHGNSCRGFTVFTRNEQVDILKTLLSGSSRKAEDAADKISRIKNFLDDGDEEIRVLYGQYQALLREKDSLDFDDLILTPIDMLGDNSLLERYRNRFRHIIVDEYQDINPAQYKLLRLLAGDKGNICVVGDADQAIYAFRGADVKNFLNFEKDFPGAGRITLSQNYRSSAHIVNASDVMIQNNSQRIERSLSPARGGGSRIMVVSAPDEKAEGEYIVRAIEARIGGTSHYALMHNRHGHDLSDRAFSFSDFAVIYRTNGQAKMLEEAFAASGIPCQIIGNRHKEKKRHIAEITALLREHKHGSDASVSLPVSSLQDLFGKIIEQGVLEDGDALRSLFNDLTRCCITDRTTITLEDLINQLSLLTPLDDFDPLAEAVTLMTLHMAKGLEFKVVFIAGVEEGLVPYSYRAESNEIEEERRLFYVGMTRARDELFLTHARSRSLYGKNLSPSPSRFIGEIPAQYLQTVFLPDRIKKRREHQGKLF